MGRISGKARPFEEGGVLRSALSGRECVYEIAEVYQAVSDQAGWRRLARVERGVKFVVDDGSGRAVVEPDGAKVVLTFDREEIGIEHDAARIEDFVKEHGGLERVPWELGRVRFREALVEVDEVITVLGAGVKEPDPDGRPDGAYRGTQVQRVRIASSRAGAVVISDDPNVIA